ncbi:MAG: peptidoglycan editing factor PgeF [Eubacteriales bacterium]|nr:peptidoglycan editing factor PgeF [Eubacteriales bacterium]
MKVIEQRGVTYLAYDKFLDIPEVVHGFSTRLGGVSEGIYSGMNLSFSRGDEETAVMENYRRMAEAVGFDLEGVVASHQTHTDHIRLVTEEDRGAGILKERTYQDIDGLITNRKGITLVTYYADCVPLFFVDPVNHAIGLAHSGWRGTVQKIGKKTVQKMQEEFGTDPKSLQVAIGPSICQECYEVSEDVIEEFRNVFEEFLWEKLWYAKPNGKYQLNLWEANRQIFLEGGVLESHISLPGLCTCCNPEFLFSHRASHGKRGNLGAFLGLRP